MAEMDMAKIVNMILENPQLVEEIRRLASKEDSEKKEVSETPVDLAENNGDTAPGELSQKNAFQENTYAHKKSRRNELLRALTPYVSEQRGKAIESMITIADIILAVREQ